MATHKSAEKRHKQSLKRKERNRQAKSAFRAEVKKVVEPADQGNTEEARAQLKSAMRKLDKAAIHGIIHKKNAARKISRLARRVNKAAASASA